MGQSVSALPSFSDIDFFSNFQSVVNLNAEVSDSTFNLGVTEQQLHCTQIPSSPVDEYRLCSS